MLIPPTHTPRGFVTGLTLLYTALTLVLGVQFFVPEKIAVFYKEAITAARSQGDLNNQSLLAEVGSSAERGYGADPGNNGAGNAGANGNNGAACGGCGSNAGGGQNGGTGNSNGTGGSSSGTGGGYQGGQSPGQTASGGMNSPSGNSNAANGTSGGNGSGGGTGGGYQGGQSPGQTANGGLNSPSGSTPSVSANGNGNSGPVSSYGMAAFNAAVGAFSDAVTATKDFISNQISNAVDYRTTVEKTLKDTSKFSITMNVKDPTTGVISRQTVTSLNSLTPQEQIALAKLSTSVKGVKLNVSINNNLKDTTVKPTINISYDPKASVSPVDRAQLGPKAAEAGFTHVTGQDSVTVDSLNRPTVAAASLDDRMSVPTTPQSDIYSSIISRLGLNKPTSVPTTPALTDETFDARFAALPQSVKQQISIGLKTVDYSFITVKATAPKDIPALTPTAQLALTVDRIVREVALTTGVPETSIKDVVTAGVTRGLPTTNPNTPNNVNAPNYFDTAPYKATMNDPVAFEAQVKEAIARQQAEVAVRSAAVKAGLDKAFDRTTMTPTLGTKDDTISSTPGVTMSPTLGTKDDKINTPSLPSLTDAQKNAIAVGAVSGVFSKVATALSKVTNLTAPTFNQIYDKAIADAVAEATKKAVSLNTPIDQRKNVEETVLGVIRSAVPKGAVVDYVRPNFVDQTPVATTPTTVDRVITVVDDVATEVKKTTNPVTDVLKSIGIIKDTKPPTTVPDIQTVDLVTGMPIDTVTGGQEPGLMCNWFGLFCPRKI